MGCETASRAASSAADPAPVIRAHAATGSHSALTSGSTFGALHCGEGALCSSGHTCRATGKYATSVYCVPENKVVYPESLTSCPKGTTGSAGSSLDEAPGTLTNPLWDEYTTISAAMSRASSVAETLQLRTELMRTCAAISERAARRRLDH